MITDEARGYFPEASTREWLKVAESAFEFWDNPLDAIYVEDDGTERAALIGEYSVRTMLQIAEQIDRECFGNHAGFLRNFDPWIALRKSLFEMYLRLAAKQQ